jgi:hypothetical protein
MVCVCLGGWQIGGISVLFNKDKHMTKVNIKKLGLKWKYTLNFLAGGWANEWMDGWDWKPGWRNYLVSSLQKDHN